jgi:hypothetical protein
MILFFLWNLIQFLFLNTPFLIHPIPKYLDKNDTQQNELPGASYLL